MTTNKNKKKKKTTMMRGFMCMQSSIGDIKTCVPAAGDQHVRSVIEPMRRRVRAAEDEGRQQLLMEHHHNDAALFRMSNKSSKSSITTTDRRRRSISLPPISEDLAAEKMTHNNNNADDKWRRSISLPSTSDHVVGKKTHNSAEQHKYSGDTTKASHSTSSDVFQVVVLKVSLHCQGCAGKVKKHLSKMEGVTSFSIDLETKRVTVMGHVSPTGVLESISKVKRAEFWVC